MFLHWGQLGDFNIFLSLTSGFRVIALTFKTARRMIINKRLQRLQDANFDSSQGLPKGPECEPPQLRVVGRIWYGALLGASRTILGAGASRLDQSYCKVRSGAEHPGIAPGSTRGFG